MITLDEPKKIHVIGVAGSVMGGMACLLSEQGHDVRGSDRDCYPPMSTRLESAGVPVHLGFQQENISANTPDLVLVGNITRRSNPEAVAMRSMGLPHVSLPELIGAMFLRHRRSITVAGTHGKTTTTSMLVHLLKAAHRDPGYMIGGIPMGYESGFSGGTGDHFVLEADEYDTAYFDKRPKFVHYRPKIGILTSVEFDHADIYEDFDSVRRSFRSYAGLFLEGSSLWVHDGNPEALSAARTGRATIERYDVVDDQDEGRGRGLNAFACDVRLACGAEPTTFRFIFRGEDLGTFELAHPGRHNVWNAVAALAVAMCEGVDHNELKTGLSTFQGVRRRQELRGDLRGIRVIQDYAHHPTAVRETLRAFRAQYPDRRIWALFEAESNTSRRNIFQEAYAEAFDSADEVIFVKPLEKDDNLPVSDRLDANQLVQDLRENGVSARFIPESEVILQTLLTESESGDVVLFMSGRNFLGLPAQFVEALAG